jgi:phosphate starvation-inducible PhoH-like protein
MSRKKLPHYPSELSEELIPTKKKRKLNPKHEEERNTKIHRLQPKNHSQERLMDAIEHGTHLIVAAGSAGTGKTYVACIVAAQMYLRGEINKIVLVHPYTPMGRSIGMLPGGINEKLSFMLAPMINVIKSIIGEGKYNNDLDKNIILMPLEFIRGMSFEEGTAVIIDEAQNCSPHEIRGVVTRGEKGSITILLGDTAQHDMRGTSGLAYLEKVIIDNQMKGCELIRFTSEDIVRSDLVGDFVRIFDREGAAPQ